MYHEYSTNEQGHSKQGDHEAHSSASRAGAPRSSPIQPPHRVRARSVTVPPKLRIERDPDVIAAFLTDATLVPGGFAPGVAFPTDTSEVAALVTAASTVLPVGAQS